MALDGITPAIVFPLFNFILRSVQTVYEVASVPAETSDYLKTISQVLADVKIARQLRRQTSDNLSKDDLTRVNDVISNTEDAMRGVEILVEKARVDMSFKPGCVSAGGRLMWVIRDQNKIGAAMGRLSIASQSLHREIIVMKTVANSLSTPGSHDKKSEYRSHHKSSSSDSSDSDTWAAPPSYLQATIDSMKERRYWNDRRNSLARQRSCSSAAGSTIGGNSIAPSFLPSKPDNDDSSSASLNNIAEYIRHNEEVLSSLTPGASTAPINTLLPARVISLPAVSEPQYSAFELEGSQPIGMPKSLSSIPTLVPQQPEVQEMQRRSLVTQPLIPSVLRTGNPFTPEPLGDNGLQLLQLRQPQLRSHAPRPAMRQVILMPSKAMESEILLPGHKTPFRLRDEELVDDHESVATHSPWSDLESENEDNDNMPIKPLSNSLTHKDLESGLDRAPTRRRPPRIQREVHINATTPNLSTDRPTVESRTVRRTLSRTDWQLERQDEELAKLRRQGAGFQ